MQINESWIIKNTIFAYYDKITPEYYEGMKDWFKVAISYAPWNRAATAAMPDPESKQLVDACDGGIHATTREWAAEFDRNNFPIYH